MSSPIPNEIEMKVPPDVYLERTQTPFGDFWELRNPGGTWGWIRADVTTPVLIKPTPPPVPDPTPTPTPDPTTITPKRIEILVGPVNIRTSPTKFAGKLAVMQTGDICTVLSNEAPIADNYVWRKVRFEKQNAEGWIVFTLENGTSTWAKGID